MKRIKNLCFVIVMAFVLNIFTFTAVAEPQQALTENEILEKFEKDLITSTIDFDEDLSSYDELLHCGATMENDFADDMILVLIKKSYSEIKQDYTLEDFPYLELDTIKTGMTYYPGNRVSLFLYLKTPGKQNVLDAISRLEKDERVYHACPDYCFVITD